MGGLVAIIFAAEFDSGKQARRLVTLSTPYLGSAKTFATLSGGWGVVQNRLAGGMDIVRQAALSWPSFYELLPRYSDPCCILGRREWAKAKKRPLDILSDDAWKQMRWLATAEENERIQSTISSGLLAAKRLKELLIKVKDGKKASHVQIVAIVGAFQKTDARYYFDPESLPVGAPKIVETVKLLGDQTVLRDSGTYLGQEGFPTFGQHESIWTGEISETEIEEIFLQSYLPEFLAEDAVLHSKEEVELASADLELDRKLAKIGDVAEGRLTLCSQEKTNQKATVEIRFLTADHKVSSRKKINGQFDTVDACWKTTSKINIEGPPGVASVEFAISGFKTFTEYVAVTK